MLLPMSRNPAQQIVIADIEPTVTAVTVIGIVGEMEAETATGIENDEIGVETAVAGVIKMPMETRL